MPHDNVTLGRILEISTMPPREWVKLLHEHGDRVVLAGARLIDEKRKQLWARAVEWAR
jgi:hypothetical protein